MSSPRRPHKEKFLSVEEQIERARREGAKSLDLVLQFGVDFPESIRRLHQLRDLTLNVVGPVTTLPQGICSLSELESLIILGGELEYLPEEIGEL